MRIRNFVFTLALAAATVAPISSHAVSLFGRSAAPETPTTPTAAKAKMVKFTVVNRTASPMTVLINDQPVTLAANAETPVRLAEGSDILSDDHTTVKLHVTGALSGNTVSFR